MLKKTQKTVWVITFTDPCMKELNAVCSTPHKALTRVFEEYQRLNEMVGLEFRYVNLKDNTYTGVFIGKDKEYCFEIIPYDINN